MHFMVTNGCKEVRGHHAVTCIFGSRIPFHTSVVSEDTSPFIVWITAAPHDEALFNVRNI